ncbi:dihydrodipicolinate synthase family protein [Blastopirellula marina]|uniref:Dihydrodipicolinate synthase family protein n=1 Tax=Blastopirellula marina TaxID=124 RepID=A0A2S8GAG2_9BACT|nr:dihydrodipicolinate synthase family protein [Blastopirellula marina]PQO41084.1 dihydrodipicolinate synthase family protein [Blastopirellula marina]PTL45960.1 dihydrodipicolinate synthase family protein [Blastopirellula marina]
MLLPPKWVSDALRSGLVIPAHPLALTAQRKLDERRQRALSRYYHAAGAGGLAVGVHTSQFEIRLPQHGLFQPMLELAAITAREGDENTGRQTVLLSGICGQTNQAVVEAKLARELGYHVGMISLAALPHASDDDLIAHCEAVAQEIPIFGFYMQTAVGGRALSQAFWRRLAQIPNLVGIKIAPFNRYQTLDVLRGVAGSGRAEEIALYTGNDDNILSDLLTPFEIAGQAKTVPLRIVGGLLGHWACWTQKAVEQFQLCKSARGLAQLPAELLSLAGQVTECNAALFDARNNFQGCIVGIHYVLKEQSLLDNLVCLDPSAQLSPGQKEEIDRVRTAYPHLVDDSFVAEHLDQWLA